MFIFPQMREPDDFGAGYFGACRGNRTHNGIDFAAPHGTVVCSACDGRLTRFGYPYGDDLSYRYVEVTDSNNDRVRYFYVVPADGKFEIGTEVKKGDVIGVVQNISARYDTDEKKMNNHFHFEVKRKGEYLDPEPWLESAGIFVT